MSIKVMIVDDTRFAKLRLKKFLENTKYEVIGEASDGEEALQLLTKIKPDIIALDMNMPKMDGLTFLKKFRSLNKDTKIVVLSAVGHEIAINNIMLAGANGFLKKPFQQEELLDIFDKIMNDN